MRQQLAVLWLSTLAGCSLIYNPSNLPDKNGPADAAIADADPTMLDLTTVKSAPLPEGAGQGGSAPHVLVVYGMHILKNATVQIAPTTANNAVTIAVDKVSIADDGNSFAALVSAGYMDMVDETGTNMSPPIPLTITVTQAGGVTKTIAWSLRPLDELTATGPQPAPADNKLYSRVQVAGDIDFMVGARRAVVKAVGSIDITGRVSANAMGRMGGAGGCNGGAANANGDCHGGGKAPSGLGGAGGGGFAAPGSPGTGGGPGAGGPVAGDEHIRQYEGSGATPNRGGGGGGSTGVGGGGGGIVELTAGGTINARTIQANGAVGEDGGLGSGGGGGAGGVVVLRAGAMLTHPQMLSIVGGGGGSGTTGAGGDGAVGRWRFDAAATSGSPPGNAPAPRRGPMIVRPTNAIFESKDASVTISGTIGDEVTLIVLYPDTTSNTSTVTLTQAMTQASVELAIGLNTVCAIVPGGNFANDEAKNCVEVAFIP